MRKQPGYSRWKLKRNRAREHQLVLIVLLRNEAVPGSRWSYPGRRAATGWTSWTGGRCRCSPQQPWSPSDRRRRTGRWARSGWPAAGTGNTTSCKPAGDPTSHQNKLLFASLLLLLIRNKNKKRKYPGILFIRTIVLMTRAPMFLPFGRMCLARAFQSAEHQITEK